MLRPPRSFLIYGTVGMELVLSVLLGLFAGHWADKKWGFGGSLTMLGFLLGVVVGFRSLWRAAQKMQRDAGPDDPPQGPPPSDDTH